MRIRRIFTLCLVFVTLGSLSLPSEAGSKAVSDETEYLAVYMEGKKVGYAIQSRVESNGRVTTSEEVSITVSRMGISMTMETKETSIETTAGEPLAFESEQKLGAVVMRMTGQVDKQGQVSLTTTSIRAPQKSTFQWPQGALMAEGLRLLSLQKGLKEGSLYFAKIFSPGIMQAVHAQIRIGPKQSVDLLGRVVTLQQVTTTLNVPAAGEIVTTSYVDDDLQVQKSVMPIAGIQVEMIACAKEFAMGQNDVLELIDKMFLASPEPLKDLSETKSITYYLVPVKDIPEVTIPSTDNQRVQQSKDGRAAVTVEPLAARAGVKFPYKGRDKAILDATKPTRYLQSDDEQVVALARQAIGDTKDAAEAARRIEAFVGDYIEDRSLSVGYASAAEVAASRQGDCSEFAVLTAAMCRAVGIPAQVVVGVAYVSDFGGHQGFGGHAWAQAYLGGKWIGLDASFKGGGRGGYDAGHIALALGDGEPADFFNLAATLGQFKVEKVVVRKK